jgi:hypothetical protein
MSQMGFVTVVDIKYTTTSDNKESSGYARGFYVHTVLSWFGLKKTVKTCEVIGEFQVSSEGTVGTVGHSSRWVHTTGIPSRVPRWIEDILNSHLNREMIIS